MAGGWNKREIADGIGIGEKEGQRRAAGGLLAEIRTDVGDNNSNIYELVQKDGASLYVWGSATIDGKLRASDIGKFVKMKYLGMAKGKSGRTYKDIDVAGWDAPLTDAMKEWPRVGEFSGEGAAKPADDFEDFPEGSDEEDDDLPF